MQVKESAFLKVQHIITSSATQCTVVCRPRPIWGPVGVVVGIIILTGTVIWLCKYLNNKEDKPWSMISIEKTQRIRDRPGGQSIIGQPVRVCTPLVPYSVA